MAEPYHLTWVFPAVCMRRGRQLPWQAPRVSWPCPLRCGPSLCVCILLPFQLSLAPVTTREVGPARAQGHGKDTSIIPLSSVWVPVEWAATGFRAG